MSARPAPQILSVKGECTFLLLNFLITGLCNSSANFHFILIFNTTTRSLFIKKRPLKQVHVDIHPISDF